MVPMSTSKMNAMKDATEWLEENCKTMLPILQQFLQNVSFSLAIKGLFLVKVAKL